MSVLWVVPLVVFAAGALFVLVALRETAEVATELREECAHLDEIRLAMVALRADGDAVRHKARSLRAAPSPSHLGR